MTIVPVMWSVWGATVLLLFALKMYTARLTRDEDDQVILHDSFDHVKIEQAALMAKVGKVEPVQRVVFWLAGAATIFVIAFYVRDILLNLHLI